MKMNKLARPNREQKYRIKRRHGLFIQIERLARRRRGCACMQKLRVSLTTSSEAEYLHEVGVAGFGGKGKLIRGRRRC